MSLRRLFSSGKKSGLDPEYVRGPLAELLGETGQGARIQRLEGATNADVARVTYASGADLAVRWWPWAPKKQKAAEHARWSALLAEHNLPIPQFVAHDGSPRTRRRWGGEAAVERFIEAPPFDPPWSPSELVAFGRLVWRMHQVDYETSGKPWRPVNEQADLAKFTRARWTQCLDFTRGALGQGPSAESCRRLLESGASRIAQKKSYEMLHGDLSPANLFRAGPEELIFCDFGAMSFGCFERELAILEGGIFLRRPEDFASFLQAYYPESELDRRQAWEDNRQFQRAFYHLEKAYSATRRAARASRLGKDSERARKSPEMAERHWRIFSEIAEEK